MLQAQKQQSSPESSQKLLIIDHRAQHMTDRRAEEIENKSSRCVFVLGSFIIGLYIYITFTFNHLADAFIQSDVQMRRTIEAIRPSREQQYTSAMTSLS